MKNLEIIGKVLSKKELKSISGGGWTVHMSCNDGRTFTFRNIGNRDGTWKSSEPCGRAGVASQVWKDNGIEDAPISA